MSGDAESGCEVNFDVGEVRSAVDSLQMIMIVPCNNEVYLSCGRSGELVAVMRDIITLCELWDVAACCDVKCLLECVERDETRGTNAVSASLDKLKES